MNLVISQDSNQLVSYNGSPTSPQPFCMWDVVPLTVQIVQATGQIGTSPYAVVNYPTSAIRVSIGSTPDTSDDNSILMRELGLVWDPVFSRFTGTLSFNTDLLLAFIGHQPQTTVYLEVKLVIGGVTPATILQIQCTLKAPIDKLNGQTVPVQLDQQITMAQALAMFAKFANDAGKTIILKSPGGAHTRELGVNDDGSAKDNIV